MISSGRTTALRTAATTLAFVLACQASMSARIAESCQAQRTQMFAGSGGNSIGASLARQRTSCSSENAASFPHLMQRARFFISSPGTSHCRGSASHTIKSASGGPKSSATIGRRLIVDETVRIVPPVTVSFRSAITACSRARR